MFLPTDAAALATHLSLCILGCFFIYKSYITRWTRRAPKGLRLPPGPPGKPILGNVADMPTHHEWETITKWGEQYGDIVYVNVLGTPIIFVNSYEVARGLFERRSSVYADRPDLRMMMLSGWDFNFAFMRYGQRWRRHRKGFHQYFNAKAVAEYHPVQIKHSRELLKKFHDTPDDFIDHMKHLTAAVIMEVVYGIQLKPKNDRFIEIAHLALEGASETSVPGAFLVELFPLLKHVPEWMPGAGFKRKARKWRKPTTEMNSTPFRIVKSALADGTAGPSIMATCLKNLASRDDAVDEEELIRNIGGVSYAGGSGTTVIALISFILAMVLYPHVQKKAQEELDTVIEEDHLPTIEDRARLPYVNALCQEIQRWRPVLPMSIPHVASNDDGYRGYFIPKGSIVVGNAWAILHNEAIYGPRPEQFEPERFLEPGAKIPTEQFGFGRRICPGRYFAEDTLFIVVACILKVFDLSKVKDANGKEIPVAGTYTATGSFLEPDPFKCSITVRSASAERLILEQLDA